LPHYFQQPNQLVDTFVSKQINYHSMKKLSLVLSGMFIATILFAQTATTNNSLSKKIVLASGQKIIVANTISMETSMSGMDITNSSSTENTLEVKSVSENNYTLTNTLTKMKVNMDMMGQSTSYDSDKPEDQNSDIGKSLADRLNKPKELVLDNSTGKATATSAKKETKNDADVADPMQGMMQMFGSGGDDGLVNSVFEQIPSGIKSGDSWSDSSVDKSLKMVRHFTLVSITGNEAAIKMTSVIDAVNTMEVQGMQMDMNSTTQSSADIITDITTGIVKKRSTVASISGSFQVMGQSIPLTAKVTSNSTVQ
jgi:hypothetical protein